MYCIILQVEIDGAAAYSKLLLCPLMHSFLKVGIKPQYLQKGNDLRSDCGGGGEGEGEGELTCLSKATQAGWFPPTPLGNTLLFFLGD